MAAAELLIMPSYLESLSMVALEAWAMGKPVLANAKCDVLQGQCLRSNAGLFYENYAEFAATMGAIDTTPSLQAALGRNGRAFFEKHYAWPVIEKKYVDMLQQLSKESAPRTMEPMPGWFGRRRRTQPPADSVLKALPSGPSRETPRHRAHRSARLASARPTAASASDRRPRPAPRPAPASSVAAREPVAPDQRAATRSATRWQGTSAPQDRRPGQRPRRPRPAA